MLLIMGACSQEDPLTFEGQSENWKINYQVYKMSNTQQDIKYNIVYIGENEYEGNIDFTIKSDSSSIDAKNITLEDNKIYTGMQNCDSCVFINKEDDLYSVVKWAELTEEIQLEEK